MEKKVNINFREDIGKGTKLLTRNRTRGNYKLVLTVKSKKAGGITKKKAEALCTGIGKVIRDEALQFTVEVTTVLK